MRKKHLSTSTLMVAIATALALILPTPATASVADYDATILPGTTVTITGIGGIVHIPLPDEDPTECAPEPEPNTPPDHVEIHVDTETGATTIDGDDYHIHDKDWDVNNDTIGDFYVRVEGVPDTHSAGQITIVPGAATDSYEQQIHLQATIYSCGGVQVCRFLPITADLFGDWHPDTQDSFHAPALADVSGHTTLFTGLGCNTVVRSFLNNRPVTANFLAAVA